MFSWCFYLKLVMSWYFADYQLYIFLAFCSYIEAFHFYLFWEGNFHSLLVYLIKYGSFRWDVVSDLVEQILLAYPNTTPTPPHTHKKRKRKERGGGVVGNKEPWFNLLKEENTCAPTFFGYSKGPRRKAHCYPNLLIYVFDLHDT
jgi:hypothetical protein